MSTITEVYKPVTPSFLIALDRDRRDGHRFLMSCLRNPALSKETPRMDAGLLWDIDPAHQFLIVRRSSSTPFEPEVGKITLLNEQRTIPEGLDLHESVVIQGRVARQFSPLIKRDPEVEKFLQIPGQPAPKRPRSRLQPVQPENLNVWLSQKLERIGLVVHQLNAEVIPDIRLSKSRRRESVPAASFSAQISGRPEIIHELLENGFGRAKNFGLGLIQIQQDSQNNS